MVIRHTIFSQISYNFLICDHFHKLNLMYCPISFMHRKLNIIKLQIKRNSFLFKKQCVVSEVLLKTYQTA